MNWQSVQDSSHCMLSYAQASGHWKGYRVGWKNLFSINYLFCSQNDWPLFSGSNTKCKTSPCCLNWSNTYSSLTCSLFVSSAKQVNMAQNSNETNSAWPWNYACLMLTLETQLNSSALNQSGAAWMNMHFDWVSGNHNPLSRAVWQPPAVQHLTCGSLQSFCFYYGWCVLEDHKLSHCEMSKTLFSYYIIIILF